MKNLMVAIMLGLLKVIIDMAMSQFIIMKINTILKQFGLKIIPMDLVKE